LKPRFARSSTVLGVLSPEIALLITYQ
jgi:hypothetical protein